MSSRRLSSLLIPACATWLDCSEPGPLAPSSSAQPENPECPASTSVLVTADTRFQSGASVTVVPEDLSSRDLELLVPRGADPVRKRGTPVRHGVCFQDVPQDAEFYLRDGASYVSSRSRHLDLGTQRHGRPDAVASSWRETPVRLELTALQPWQGPDSQLQVVSGQVELTADLAFPEAARPVAGSTFARGMDARATSRRGLLPVLDAARGDGLYVHQLNRVDSGAFPSGAPLAYRTVVGSLHAPAVAFTPDGDRALTLEGALEPARQASFALNWDLGHFARWGREVGPSAEVVQGRFDVQPVTFGLRSGRVGDQGELFSLEVPATEGGVLERSFTYGNPYPKSWGLVGAITYTYQAATPVTVDGQTWRQQGRVRVVNALGALQQDDPLVTAISPPRGLSVDGVAAADIRTVSSLRPTVRWLEPQEGLPRAFSVEFIPLSRDASRPTVRFDVPGDRLELSPPEDVLTSGLTYYVRVTANGSPFFAPWQAPNSSADLLPILTADAFSAAFTAP